MFSLKKTKSTTITHKITQSHMTSINHLLFPYNIFITTFSKQCISIKKFKPSAQWVLIWNIKSGFQAKHLPLETTGTLFFLNFLFQLHSHRPIINAFTQRSTENVHSHTPARWRWISHPRLRGEIIVSWEARWARELEFCATSLFHLGGSLTFMIKLVPISFFHPSSSSSQQHGSKGFHFYMFLLSLTVGEKRKSCFDTKKLILSYNANIVVSNQLHDDMNN